MSTRSLCLLALAALWLTAPLGAQQPEQSPRAVVEQVVGTQALRISYHSPGVKERKIWGELVPFGQNWRAGANDKTTVEFPFPVEIEGTRIKAGTYGFYVFPQSAGSWEFVFNRSATGSPNEFMPEEDVLRVKVTPREVPFRERALRYSFDNFTDWPPFTAEITLEWERLAASVKIEVLDPFEPP